jgi:predicted kinase
VEIIDCIEFNERFRFGDVAGEIAFLTMELDEAGRPDLARAFADAYVAASGDEGLVELLPFYACYRACVRGKVLAFELDEAEIPGDQQEEARSHAQALFALAARYTRYPTAPTLLIVGGTMGVGKSTLATSLGHTLGWKVVSSDAVRKRLAGVAPSEPHADAYGAGLYTTDWTERTYRALRGEALALLGDARSVILDASFARRAERLETSKLAAEMGARAVFVECRCSREVAMQRLAERWRTRQDVSDGRPELLDAQAAAWEPVTSLEAECTRHLIVPTEGPREAAEEQLKQLLLGGQSWG